MFLGLILALFFAATKLFPSLKVREGLGVSYERAVFPISQNLPPPVISARNIFIIDRNSKIVLYQKAADQQVFPASTTKMMTALVALDQYDLGREITVTTSYPEGQNLKLTPGEKLTVNQLLYALLVQSANDAAEVLAENFAGGRAAFISAMNTKAVDLRLTATHFINPSGLDETGHYSTAADLARLADSALVHPEFAKIVATENAVIATHVLTNINQLLGKVPGVLGVKTGNTLGAGQSLVTLVDRDSHPVIIVVLGSTDRFGDSEKLINWVYSNYRWE
ncbi:MAG: D-alanyl-D-alanine carboxypeptidase family protein [Patescibacteria group bacterium]